MPGPADGLDAGAALDSGTIGRQRYSPPVPTDGGGVSRYHIPGPILVGKPPRDPGKKEDGTDHEDMLFADSPAQSASIKDDPVFKLSDDKLKELGNDLMTSVSTGDLETVALECWERFCQGTGGTYSNTMLTAEVAANDATLKFVAAFEKQLRQAVVDLKCDLTNFTPLPIGRYAFESDFDKATGLGIIVHDWWSIKAELKGYTGA